MLIALTRELGPHLDDCLLTHRTREPVDVARAARQHRAYGRALADLGCRVLTLPAEPDLPDAVFVEDTAVVVDEVAVIARPGHAARRPETPSVEAALAGQRPLERIRAPGTLDGGDILRAGTTVFAGRSSRTNDEGIGQLEAILAPHGYRVVPVPVAGCLHLKSACTDVGDDLLLVNRSWIDAGRLAGFDLVDVDPAEPGAANHLRVGAAVLGPAGAPRTAERLRGRGVDVRPVDLSELAKVEGGLTCCSILLREAG